MLELLGMQTTPSLPSLPVPLRSGVVPLDRVLSMGAIELNNGSKCLLFLHLNCLFILKWIARNRSVLNLNCLLMLNWIIWNKTVYCSVSWGCIMHRLHLCKGVRLPPNQCPRYDTKQSDGEFCFILELWGLRSCPSLPSLSSPLWTEVLAPDRVISMVRTELKCVLMLLLLNWIV